MGTTTQFFWLDNALLDGMDYFSGTFFYFLKIANKLAFIVAIVGIAINCVKLWFGGQTTQKFALSSMANFFIFIAAISIYNAAVKTIAFTATSWGSNAGGGKAVVTHNLINVMEQCKNDLQIAKEIQNMSPKAAEAAIKKARRKSARQVGLARGREINGGKGVKTETSSLVEDVADKNGPEEYMNKVNLYRSTEDNIVAAEANIAALSAVLKPTKVRSKDGTLIDSYFLDVMIRDRRGSATSFISPSAFLKISILLGKLLWQRELNFLTVKMGEAEDNYKNNGKLFHFMPSQLVSFSAITINDIANILLTMITIGGLVAAAIFILIQYCATIFEYSIVTSICIAFVPFVLANETHNVAKKILPSFWGLAIKLLILTICMWFALYQYVYLVAGQMGETASIDLAICAYIIFIIILSFVVTQSAPAIANTILNGEPKLSMGEFLAAAGTMGAAATVAAKVPSAAKKITNSATTGAGKAINAGGTALGRANEIHSAAKTASQGIASKGGTKFDQALGGTIAAAGTVGSHIKNGLQNKIHNLSHASNKDSAGFGKGSGSSFVNRFSGQDGKTPNAKFNQAKNFDANGNPTTSQTFSEYMNSMGIAGSDIGSAVAAGFRPKPPKNQAVAGLPPPDIQALPPPSSSDT